MTDDREKICQLIVRQCPAAGADLDRLLQDLQVEFGLDAYTARQRLIGPALAMLDKGCRDRSGRIAGLLRRHGIAC